MTKTEIATIPTGDRNAIKVQLVARNEQCFIDVRHIFKDDFGEWIFTKKGLHITPEVAKEVTIALADAIKRC